MAGQYKISIRKVLQVFFTLVVTVGCIIAISAASRVEGSRFYKNYKIDIESNKLYHFIEEEQVKKKTGIDNGIDVKTTPIDGLDIAEMERKLEADEWIDHARLFVDNQRVLHIEIAQRIPVARLFMQDGSSFFMDKTLSLMPIKTDFVFYTCVVTNVPRLGKDSASMALKGRMWALLKTIQADSFWNAQISQVIIDSNNSFELIPVIGNHKIVFGDTNRMAEKFSNLYAFYNKVLNRIGWDRYEVLDVRFRNQIVASPELKYHMPETKSALNWDWVRAYITQEKKRDSSGQAQALQPHYERPVIHKIVLSTTASSTGKTPKPTDKKHPAKAEDKKNQPKQEDKKKPAEKPRGKEAEKTRTGKNKKN